MYVDKLDGLIKAEFLERTSSGWREDQTRCQRQIELHQVADQSYLDKGVQLLELARSAQSLLSRQEPREERRLLNFILSNCVWEDGTINAEFRRPFALFAEATTEVAALSGTLNSSGAKSEIWLGN